MYIVIFLLLALGIIFLVMLHRSRRGANFFEHHYIESKALYYHLFRKVPCVTYTDSIDISKAYKYIDKYYRHDVVNLYQTCYLNREKGIQEFNKTLFVLKDDLMIELQPNFARILYPSHRYRYVDTLLKKISEFKLPEKVAGFEISIITLNVNGLELKRLPVNPTHLDIGLYYNDDFKEVDAVIRSRLNQENDKGIVLLHGLPGTGKTTYLRYLIGDISKRVLFVAPSVAGNLMNPEFIDLLIDNPNAVLVIEDAENIIMDRKYNNNSSVSNLLNLSDGLLSDCLNVQIICTFNNSLSLIDSALMRKGRLIACYEFGKLSVKKAQLLSDHLGFKQQIVKPMTLAEVANPDEKDYAYKQVNPIGFKKEIVEN
jgi:hypothetical protein